MNLKELTAPFTPDQLEWRPLRSGMKGDKAWAIVAPYVQSRAIMQRLDEVCGPENWQVQHFAADKGVITSIGIKVEDTWVWKSDGAGFTDVESFKGGISDGLKRAGVPWGIGRYLYDLPTPMFAEFNEHGKYQVKIDGKYYKWNPPDISKSSQTHEEAPGGRLDEVKDILVGKLKDATDAGLFTAAEMTKKLSAIHGISDIDVAENSLKNLNKAIRARSAEQDEDLAVI